MTASPPTVSPPSHQDPRPADRAARAAAWTATWTATPAGARRAVPGRWRPLSAPPSRLVHGPSGGGDGTSRRRLHHGSLAASTGVERPVPGTHHAAVRRKAA